MGGLIYMIHNTLENLSHTSGYILIVEDSYVQAEILAMLLEENGYIVKKASNGQIALETAQQELPILVISDILMPKMNGFELTRKIRADPVLAHIPILLLTSLTEAGDVAQALSCGADTFVTKPYEDSFLLKKISSLLKKKEPSKKPKRVSTPFKFTYEGQEYEIDADRERILAFLLTTYEITMDRNQSLIRSENELRELNNHLELRVEERTKDLRRSHEDLQVSYDNLAAAEEELRQQYRLLAEQESHIRENETLLNDVGKILRVGGWELDIETQIVRWTKETYWIHEIPEDESYYLSQAILFFDLPDRTLFEVAIQRCIEKQEPYDLELRFTSAKGRHLWIRAKGYAVTAGDRIIKLVGTIQDITERKRIEDEITLKNIILSTQQETSPDGVLVVDETAKIISYNQRFIDIWDIPEDIIVLCNDELALRSVMGKLQNPDEFLTRIKYLYEHPGEKSREEISLLDGRVLDRFSAPMNGKDARYFGRVWYFRDITNQKQAEWEIRTLNQDLERRIEERTKELQQVNDQLLAINEELSASEEELRVQIDVTNEAYDALEKSEGRFHSMFERHDSVMLLIDSETGKIIDANFAAERFYGKSQADIRKQFIHDINTLPPEEIDTAMMEAVQEKNNCFTFPHQIVNGEIRMVEVHSSPIDFGGKTILFSIIHDITDREKMSEQIKASLVEKETLLREVHHRVKNNLQIIISLLNLQIRRMNDPVTIETLNDCQNRVRSMALVHEHLYKGKDISQIDLGNYIKALGTGLFQSYEDERRSIQFDISIQDIYVDINIAIPLGLISNELIINSLKYAFSEKKGGILSLNAREDSKSLYFIVADNGGGIPEEITLESQDSMGLRLISMFADQLNATVVIDRTEGTKFTFTIPKPKEQKPMEEDAK